MYAAAPMPNTPAVPPLYVPGGVDSYGFYALSPSAVMAPDALTSSSPTPAASLPSTSTTEFAATPLAEEVAYWEESFRAYLGLCAVLDGLSATPSCHAADPQQPHPQATPRFDTQTPHHTCPSASRLRAPVRGVCTADTVVDQERTGRVISSNDKAHDPSGGIRPPGEGRDGDFASESPPDHCEETRQHLRHPPSPATLAVALDGIERDWEARLWHHGGSAHSELRRLLWSFWSGAAHRTAEEQEAADALYAQLAADDSEVAGDAEDTPAHTGSPPTEVDAPYTGLSSPHHTRRDTLAAPLLRREEADTIDRDLGRTFPTHCLFTAAADAPAPAHLAQRPTFLFSPTARAAVVATAAKATDRRRAVEAQTAVPASTRPNPPVLFAVGQTELRRILRAYSRLDPEVGYCQGMSFVAAVLLLHAPEAEAFQIFYCLLQNPVHSLRDLYAPRFGFLHTLMQVLDRQVRQLLPVLHRHLQQEGVTVAYFAATWFLTLFATQLPLPLVVHLWDWFMLKGWPVMLQTAIAVLQWHQDELLTMDMEAILLTLKGLKTATYPRTTTAQGPRASLFADAAAPCATATHTERASEETESPGPAAKHAVRRTSLTRPSSSVSLATSPAAVPGKDSSTVTRVGGERGDDEWLAYLNEPAVPAEQPAPHERGVTAEDTAEALRRILQVPIDLDDTAALW